LAAALATALAHPLRAAADSGYNYTFKACFQDTWNGVAYQGSSDAPSGAGVSVQVFYRSDGGGWKCCQTTADNPFSGSVDGLSWHLSHGKTYDLQAVFLQGPTELQRLTVTGVQWGNTKSGGTATAGPGNTDNSTVSAGTDNGGGAPGGSVAPPEDSGGPFVRLIASIIDGIREVCDWASKTFLGEKSYSTLIFNAGLSDQDKEYAPFTHSEMDSIWTWYKAVASGTFVLILIAVVVTAFKFTASPFSMALREDAVASLGRWLWAILIIAGAPILCYAMIRINNGLVDLFLNIASQVSPGKGLDAVMLDPESMDVHTGYVLATALVKMVFSFIRLWLTILYSLRRIVLIVILIFTPVMAWLWALNKKVNAAQIWLGEVLSNIFMQASHAFVFLILLSFINTGSEQQAASGYTGSATALGSSLLDLLNSYGLPLGGAVLLASVCWTAFQIITSRFNPGKKEGAIGNLLYVGVGGIIFGGVLFFSSFMLGIAHTYFPHVFLR
jgi:hypothetical protein